MTYFEERTAGLGSSNTYPAPTPALAIANARSSADGLPDGDFTDIVQVHGRVSAVRGHGRMVFADLADNTGHVQLMVSQGRAAGAHELAQSLHVGDVISASGQIGRSRRGEVSIMVDDLQLLAPALRPLPDPHVGIQDPELLRRDRTMDLLVHSPAREQLVLRSRIVQAMRQELLAGDYLEVDTPILQAYPAGAASESFVTHTRALGQDRHLRAAPEFYLERLVIAGLPRVFEFARNFRNEGVDRTHNPEFTALEWYGAFETPDMQMQRCRQVLAAACTAAASTMFSEIQERTFEDLWRQHHGCDPMDEAAIRTCLGPGREGDHAQLLNTGWEAIEPQLTDAVFVTRWPALLSPLARPYNDDANWCDRWDLYALGMELGACYQELNDPILQRQIMEASGVVDEEFLYDMLLGMPPMSGAGLGIDRIVMLLTGAEHIREVLSFPDFRR